MELPRGMKDFEPDELAKIEHIRQKFQETAQLFGFKQMEPSALELLSTLEKKGGQAIKDEIYFFEDKKTKPIMLALRFDYCWSYKICYITKVTTNASKVFNLWWRMEI